MNVKFFNFLWADLYCFACMSKNNIQSINTHTHTLLQSSQSWCGLHTIWSELKTFIQVKFKQAVPNWTKPLLKKPICFKVSLRDIGHNAIPDRFCIALFSDFLLHAIQWRVHYFCETKALDERPHIRHTCLSICCKNQAAEKNKKLNKTTFTASLATRGKLHIYIY